MSALCWHIERSVREQTTGNFFDHALLYAHPSLAAATRHLYADLLPPARLYAPCMSTVTRRYTRRLQSMHTHLPARSRPCAERHRIREITICVAHSSGLARSGGRRS